MIWELTIDSRFYPAIFNCQFVKADIALLNELRGIDVFFIIFSGALIFFMQTGFAMLCSGSVRSKNVQNVILKNILDACGGAIGFWFFGYAFAYGGEDPDTVTFIGNKHFLLHDSTIYFQKWFFNFSFAATTATIVAGTIAERCQMIAYLGYSLLITGFVYPVVVHAVWSESGFLSAFNTNPLLGYGMIDHAGSGVVCVGCKFNCCEPVFHV
mmetsp:Transcript_15455/g.34699  ORF Transcript_15455/g.34699 Transcript_15455/m.34699 type:complete len:212 (+) Transcript_15455:71-706(+)